MPRRHAPCPSCEREDVRALIDVTVHVRVLINGGAHLGTVVDTPAHVRASVRDQGLDRDTDLVCGACGWIGRPRDLT